MVFYLILMLQILVVMIFQPGVIMFIYIILMILRMIPMTKEKLLIMNKLLIAMFLSFLDMIGKFLVMLKIISIWIKMLFKFNGNNYIEIYNKDGFNFSDGFTF